jgi:hypothetical protein
MHAKPNRTNEAIFNAPDRQPRLLFFLWPQPRGPGQHNAFFLCLRRINGFDKGRMAFAMAKHACHTFPLPGMDMKQSADATILRLRRAPE